MLGSPVKFVDRDYVIFEGKKLLYLSGIDYHRLSNDPEILKALSEAAFEYGISPTGSRTTVGNHFLYVELEEKIAGFFGSEASTVLASGYLANTVLLQAVADEYDVFFLDEASHSSLVDAALPLGREMIYFQPSRLPEFGGKSAKAAQKKFEALDYDRWGFPSPRGNSPPRSICGGCQTIRGENPDR